MPVPVLLQPRQYASVPGKLLLVPLLPIREPGKHLPPELWHEIFAHTLSHEVAGVSVWCWSLLQVCKTFRDIALPLLYSKIQLMGLPLLEKFYDRLYTADQKWDSIRRIPFSTPGRWVQVLDLSELAWTGQLQALYLDSALTAIFPLVPFGAELYINPSFVLSRRALHSLAHRDGAVNLRVLGGLTYLTPPSSDPDEDPFVQLLRCCPGLEQLDIVGRGLEPMDHEWLSQVEPFPMEHFRPIQLSKLQVLTLLSMPSSPLMHALLQSALPSLRKLTLTPYNDLPYPNSLSSALIDTHGQSLTSLLFYTPKSWPTRLRPSPDDLFIVAPKLRHLSLENPLPDLILSEPHNLRILSIPRPRSEYWRILEKLFSNLPQLAIVRARDVRWLRKGISSMARDTGVQGEMREWRRRLARRRIRLLDADWKED